MNLQLSSLWGWRVGEARLISSHAVLVSEALKYLQRKENSN